MEPIMKKKRAKPPLGPRLHRGVAFDDKAPKGMQYVITEEYLSGYVVLGRFPTAAAAHKHLKGMK